MKLPLVSRKKLEKAERELYINKKISENMKKLLDESTERNHKLNIERLQEIKRADKFENLYKGLVNYSRCIQSNSENLDTLLRSSRTRESQLVEINHKLQNKINKFGINTASVLEREKNKQRKSRKKKQKQREIDNFIIDSVFEAIVWEEE